ncbi:unnamed protein product [Cylindrotheca closterium]|uniref:B box-type domain-containing protein n=1 Tax=Cylindrotheca closterium TaxID=2856 RepID=A0AAD2FT96_9STRA|nr:unnamed protein product [Cylindrotheca closterium]
MLPHYQYKHYYDQLCDCCEDAMVTLDERQEEGGECGGCEKTMCEDCHEGQQCGRCDVTFCNSCVISCEFCDDELFCGHCLEDHQQNCTTCEKTMCEDCRACDLCDENCCADCVDVCKFCNDEFLCVSCLEDHQQNCTPLTRIIGKLDKLDKSLEHKESEKARLRRRLGEINQDIDGILAQKASAERSLEKLVT